MQFFLGFFVAPNLLPSPISFLLLCLAMKMGFEIYIKKEDSQPATVGQKSEKSSLLAISNIFWHKIFEKFPSRVALSLGSIEWGKKFYKNTNF